MSALKWAALPVVAAGVLTGNVPFAAADEPAPPPAPRPAAAPALPSVPSLPTPAPEPSATPTPEPAPAAGSVVYLTTVTTTTTTVNAPITVVAAPITTTLNTTSSTDRMQARERLVMDLTGCGRARRRPGGGVRHAHVRLARDAILVVRVNRRRVATLRLPSTAGRRALRVRLAPNGMLSIRRPSGRLLAVQGCTPA
jgi:hypothetical protein